MNDLPRQTLCNIINQYGISICDDARRFEGILRDLCGSHKREIHLLISALRERVPNELMNSSRANMPKEIMMARLAKRLQDDLAITLEASKWAIESWAIGLGVITVAELSQSTPSSNISVTAPKVQSQPLRGPIDLSNSLEIRGFSLGMSLSQVLKRLPKGIKLKPPDEYGIQVIHITFSWNSPYYSIHYVKDANYYYQYGNDVNHLTCSSQFPTGDGLSSLAGLKGLSFWFLDGEVIYIRLIEASIEWSGLNDFIRETLGIEGKWDRETSFTKELWIKGQYYIKAWEMVSDIGLDLSDVRAWQIIENRKSAK